MIPKSWGWGHSMYLRMGSKVGIEKNGDRKGDGDFYLFFRNIIRISIDPKSMNPRLMCDLYEP